MKKARAGYLVLTVLGLVVVLTYLSIATGLIRGGGNILIALVFSIGPVAIAGMLGLYDRLADGAARFLPRVGVVFLVIGFAFFNLMLVVQIMVQEQFHQFMAKAPSQAARESLRAIYRGVDLVQLGIDVSFDMFYCLGMALVSVAMLDHRDFGKWFGVTGATFAGLLLLFNLWTFPYIPANMGLVDLGPLTGLWWLAVIIQMMRLDWRDRRAAVS